MRKRTWDSDQLNRDIIQFLPEYLFTWLVEDGQMRGDEYFVIVKPEFDVTTGMYRVNMRTGQWINALTDESGENIMSLLMYLTDQTEEWVAYNMMGRISYGYHKKPKNTTVTYIDISSENSDCSSSIWPKITPLENSLGQSAPYPISSIPQIARDAIVSYQEYGQQPLPIIAIAALSNISLACQGLADISRDKILSGPISLSFIVTADSGERKTSADKVFSAAVREWEKALMDTQQDEIGQFKSAYDVYEAKRKGLLQEISLSQKSNHKGPKPDSDKASQQLQELDANKPEAPVIPVLLFEDITQEALVEQLANGWPSASLYSDEAAIVIGSHGFHPERCLRYFGFINRMWDGNSYKRQRATTEDCYIYGRRLTCSLMMQFSVLKSLMNVADGQSRNTGFLARILLACPESTMGSRFYKEPKEADKYIEAFNGRIKELLAYELPMNKDEINTVEQF